MPDTVERRTYKMAEVAKILGVSEQRAYDSAAAGEFPSIRLGRRILVPRHAFDRWLENAGQADERLPAA